LTIYCRARTFFLFPGANRLTNEQKTFSHTSTRDEQFFSFTAGAIRTSEAESRLKIPANESTVKAELKADDDEKKSRFSGWLGKAR
jgi:hypothetical protein